MKKLFKSEQKVIKEAFINVPKEVIEKRIIFEYLSELPINVLKELIDFKEIDFENKKLWADSREDKSLFDLLCILRYENVVQYTCELSLNTDS